MNLALRLGLALLRDLRDFAALLLDYHRIGRTP